VYADDGLHKSDPSVVRVWLNRKDRRTDDVELSRSKRDVRPARLVEIPENMIGDVIDTGSGRRHDFFAFKEPPPRQLEISPLSGTVRVRSGERLDFETEPEIDFVVVITNMDDASGIVSNIC